MTLASDTAQHGPVESPAVDAGLLAPFVARYREAPSTVQFVLAHADGRDVVTHAMLWDGGQRYAHLYRRRRAEPGSVVLIALRSSPDLLYAFVGAILAGCVPAMMPLPSTKQDPQRFWDGHDRLFSHIGGGIMVTDAADAPEFGAAIAAGLLSIVTPADAVPDRGDPILWAWDPDAVCCLQHSSGTTGLKKGVTLTARAIATQIASYSSAIGLRADDVICSLPRHGVRRDVPAAVADGRSGRDHQPVRLAVESAVAVRSDRGSSRDAGLAAQFRVQPSRQFRRPGSPRRPVGDAGIHQLLRTLQAIELRPVPRGVRRLGGIRRSVADLLGDGRNGVRGVADAPGITGQTLPSLGAGIARTPSGFHR